MCFRETETEGREEPEVGDVNGATIKNTYTKYYMYCRGSVSKPYYYAFHSNHIQLLSLPGPSIQLLFLIPKSLPVTDCPISVYVYMRVTHHSTVKAVVYKFVPVLWHLLTIPNRYVAVSPQETSTFRFRKVACWVQPKHILPLSQKTQGKVTGLCLCIFMLLPKVCLSS